MAAGANQSRFNVVDQLGFPQAIRVFGALLALEAVTGLGRIMSMPRTDVPAGWDERTILTAFLDYVRATVHAECEHLAEDDARRAPLPTSPLMTLAGLVNHLRWVEYFWFQVMLLGEEDHGSVDRGGSRPGDAHRRGGSDRPAAG